MTDVKKLFAEHQAKPGRYPDHTLEDAVRAAGARVVVLWEIRGPRNTQIAWQTCMLVNGGLCIVQTFKGGGWNALTDSPSPDVDATIADVLARCSVPSAAAAGAGQNAAIADEATSCGLFYIKAGDELNNSDLFAWAADPGEAVTLWRAYFGTEPEAMPGSMWQVAPHQSHKPGAVPWNERGGAMPVELETGEVDPVDIAEGGDGKVYPV